MDEDDADAGGASGGPPPSWRSAGDYSTQLQLTADEGSQFSAFSSGHSATIFVVDASTDMLRTQLAGTNNSQSAFRWAVGAVLASVRQLVFSNRNDHVGLVLFGCRQQPKLLQDEEFDDDSDELDMRTAHTVMYLHKAGLDTLRALYKLSKIDEDKIERQCESLTPGSSSASSVPIVVGEALWKTHRMLEYANQWFASKRVVILTVSDDPHGVGGHGGSKGRNKQTSAAELAQKFTCDRAERLHEAGTEVFIVPFKLAGDAEFDMSRLYDKVQKITTKSAHASALEISPDNVDDIENQIQTLVESPIIKRPLCTLPLRLSSTCALQLAVYHPITKFTKLPLVWLKPNRKQQATNGAADGASGAADAGNVQANGDAGNGDDDADGNADDDAGGGDQRMHVIKRKRVFVDPGTSGVIPTDEIKKRMFVLGRDIIFSAQEAKSWKDFGMPNEMEVLASCPLYLAQRFMWRNYIKPTLFVTVKLTGEVQDQKATLKVFRSLLEACQSQSRALVVRYTPPARLGTTRIALLVPDVLAAEIPPTADESNHDTTTTTQQQKRGKRGAASKKSAPPPKPAPPAGFQMFIVPYIQELRDVVEKLYERANDNVRNLLSSGSQRQQLLAKYIALIDALRDEWTPQKYYNPAIYQYYLKLEAQVCKWPRNEVPKDLDDPTVPDYDDMAARAGKLLADLQRSAKSEAPTTSRGGRKKPAATAASTGRGGRARGGRAAAIREDDEVEEVDEPEVVNVEVEEAEDDGKRSRASRRKPPAATATVPATTTNTTTAARGSRRGGRRGAGAITVAAVQEDEQMPQEEDEVEVVQQPSTKRGRSRSPPARASSRTSSKAAPPIAASQLEFVSAAASAAAASGAPLSSAADAANMGTIGLVEYHARHGTLHLVDLDQLVLYCELRGLQIDVSVREALVDVITDHVGGRS